MITYGLRYSRPIAIFNSMKQPITSLVFCTAGVGSSTAHSLYHWVMSILTTQRGNYLIGTRPRGHRWVQRLRTVCRNSCAGSMKVKCEMDVRVGGTNLTEFVCHCYRANSCFYILTMFIIYVYKYMFVMLIVIKNI